MNRLYITTKCIVAEIIGGILGLVALISGAVQAFTLTGPIPVHYNFSGEPDAMGSPLTAMLLPAIVLLVNGIVAVCLHRVPVEKWNRPKSFAVRPGHEIAVYRDFALMMALMEPGLGAFALLGTVANWVNQSVFMQAVTIGLLAYLAVVIAGGYAKAARDNRG